MTMTDDEIIRARLLVDERPLKRLIKKFYAIAHSNSEELDSSYAQFVLELDSQNTIAGSRGKTANVSQEEIKTYEGEITRIEQEMHESTKLIGDLKQDLAAAQQSRRNKIIYDAIAKEALKLPSRTHSAETISRLSAELKDLEAEQQKYAVTWANRQDAFGAIVRSLEELGERVKEEKSEQERKDALRDDDVQEDQPAKGGDESSAEDTDSAVQPKPKLNPSAATFEPSPLRTQQLSAEHNNEDGQSMQVDEEGEHSIPPRSRTASTREEGEEEENIRQEQLNQT